MSVFAVYLPIHKGKKTTKNVFRGLNLAKINYRGDSLCEKCPNAEFFWSVFSCFRSECGGDILRKSPYSVAVQENADQKKLRISTLFPQ